MLDYPEAIVNLNIIKVQALKTEIIGSCKKCGTSGFKEVKDQCIVRCKCMKRFERKAGYILSNFPDRYKSFIGTEEYRRKFRAKKFLPRSNKYQKIHRPIYHYYLKNLINNEDDIVLNLLLTGSGGSGKTAVLAGLVRMAIDKNMSVYYIRAGEYFRMLIEAIKKPEIDLFLAALKHLDVLAIDDLGVEKANDFFLQRLAEVISYRLDANKITWMCLHNKMMLGPTRNQMFSFNNRYAAFSESVLNNYIVLKLKEDD